MKPLLTALTLAVLAVPALANPDPGSSPAAVPDTVKEAHPTLVPTMHPYGSSAASVANAYSLADKAATTANLALGMSVLQFDLTQDNYISGGFALYDGETVGAVGYSRSVGRADVGMLLSTDGHETAVGVFAGFGF